MKKLTGIIALSTGLLWIQACEPAKAPSPVLKYGPGKTTVCNKQTGENCIIPGPRDNDDITQIDDKPTVLPYVDEGEVIRLIDDDVNGLPSGERFKVRYFTLHTASNRGLNSNDLLKQRLSFKKIINSISKSTSLYFPVALDANKLVYRVDVTQLEFTDPKTFDAVINDFYPFGRILQDGGGQDDLVLANKDEDIRRNTGDTKHYLIRMDWFNATATLPIPYQRFLNLPEDLTEFENQFVFNGTNLNRIQNIRDALGGGVSRLVRTGSEISGVSENNRVIERHDMAGGRGYYISYDFAALKLGDPFAANPNGIANALDVAQHKIVSAPLGPKGVTAGLGLGRGAEEFEFNHDGGEAIFMLPNDLFGYYLIDAQGNLLDNGPLNIVRQRGGAPQPFLDAIVNGQSCMSCHQGGILEQKDTIVQGVQDNQNIPGNVKAAFKRLYNPDLFQQKLDIDNSRYEAAMQKLGLPRTFGQDPVIDTFAVYNNDLGRADVMAELDVTDSQLSRIIQEEPFKDQWIGLSVEGGKIKRESFNDLYKVAIDRFVADGSIELIEAEEKDFLIDTDCMKEAVVTLQMDKCGLIRQDR